MLNRRLPQLSALLTRLFAPSATRPAAELTLLLGGLAGTLALSASALPHLARYLLMLAAMAWLAPPCPTSPRWRGAWLGCVGLLALGLGLEVSALLLA